jgi:hypothetical protein
VIRLRAWWWRRTHRPFDWHEALPELRQRSHVHYVSGYPKRSAT